MNRVGSIFKELRNRGVLQAAAFYIVAAWVLLQASDVLFPGAGIPESAIRFVFTGALLGFPLVMIFGWMYDITGKGIRRTPPARSHSDDNLPLKRSDYLVLSVLASLGTVLLATVALRVVAEIDTIESAPADFQAADNSIAVLPFVNLSNDPENEYFGDGMAEELLNELANLNSLHVAARTSSFYFKGKREPISAMGRKLRVKTILEGSVRRSGDRIRVTAQLINASDGYHLWSKNYDVEAGDIFVIQEEIARSIASTLEVKLLGEESRRLAAAPTKNFDAYDYYLLALHHREARNPESLAKSVELLQQALDLDGRFAPAYAALASSYLYQAYFSDLSPERVGELTEPLIEKSLELDPDLPEAHAARASVRLLLHDFPGAETGFRRALELKPNYAGAWSSLGWTLVRQSRLDEAAAAYEKSEQLDPLNASLQYNIAALRMLTGNYEEGIEYFESVIRLAPERARTEAALAHWTNVYGRYEEAAHWVRRVLEREPDSTSAPESLATIYTNLGMWDEARDAIARAQETSADDTKHELWLANHHYLTGDHAKFASVVGDAYQKIDKLAASRYSPTNMQRYLWHGIVSLLEGNYVQAENDFTDAAGGKEGIENVVYDHITPVKYLALALSRQGKTEDARALLEKCKVLAEGALEQGWATPTIYYRYAQVLALLGEKDEAVTQLKQAFKQGWLKAARLERDPLWDSLRDDVRFQATVTDVNLELERQREAIPELLDGLQ